MRSTQERTSWWNGPGGGREVLAIAWPLILANSFSTLQLTLDRVLLGRHNSDEVGAALAAVLFFWTPLTLLQFTINYVTSFVAQYRGAGQPERVGAAVWQSLYLAAGGGLAFLCLYPLSDTIVAWAGHEPTQQVLEAEYFRCLCFAAPAFLLTAAVSGFFAGLGNSRAVLAINAIGFAINGILGYLWIFGVWGFPEAGITGAGWATVVGTWVAALVGLVLFLRPEHREVYRTLAGWRFDADLMRRLLRHGIPNGIMGTLETLAFTLFIAFVGQMRPTDLNATSIAVTLNLIAYLPIMGVAQASGVLVSQRLGEERPDLAARAVWSSLRIALALTALLATAFLVIPYSLVATFHGPDKSQHWQEIAELAAELLRFVVVYCLFDAANIVFSFSLRGAGDTLFVSIATVAVSFPVMVLPAWLSAKLDWGVYAAWAFASAYPICGALLFGWRFALGGWRSLRIIEKKIA